MAIKNKAYADHLLSIGYNESNEIIRKVINGTWLADRDRAYRNGSSTHRPLSAGLASYQPAASSAADAYDDDNSNLFGFPPAKKRRLSLQLPFKESSSFKTTSSSLKPMNKSKAFTKTFGGLDPIPSYMQSFEFNPNTMKFGPLFGNQQLIVNHMQLAHPDHVDPLQDTINIPPSVPYITSSTNSFGFTSNNKPLVNKPLLNKPSSNETVSIAQPLSNKPLVNKSIAKPLCNDTFTFKTKRKNKKFSIKAKGKGKGKRKKKVVQWYENEQLYQKTKELGTQFHSVWKRVDWISIDKDDEAWNGLSAFERGTMVLAIHGAPMSIADIEKFITDHVCANIKKKTMILCASRSGKACAAFEDGYYFVEADDVSDVDVEAEDEDETPGDICKAMWD
eukprot:420526_1